MFILNGGAFIALPAFAEILGGVKEESAVAFTASTEAFITGLVLIAVATLLAYFSSENDKLSIGEIIHQTRRQLNFDYSPPDDEKARSQELNEIEMFRMRSEDFYRGALLFRGLAVIIGLAAMGAFILGALEGATVLANAT